MHGNAIQCMAAQCGANKYKTNRSKIELQIASPQRRLLNERVGVTRTGGTCHTRAIPSRPDKRSSHPKLVSATSFHPSCQRSATFTLVASAVQLSPWLPAQCATSFHPGYQRSVQPAFTLVTSAAQFIKRWLLNCPSCYFHDVSSREDQEN
jgi:hypothetical protein